MSSIRSNIVNHAIVNLAVKTQLFRATSLCEHAPRRKEVLVILASTPADSACQRSLKDCRSIGWRRAWQRLSLRSSLAALNLAVRVWLPRAADAGG